MKNIALLALFAVCVGIASAQSVAPESSIPDGVVTKEGNFWVTRVHGQPIQFQHVQKPAKKVEMLPNPPAIKLATESWKNIVHSQGSTAFFVTTNEWWAAKKGDRVSIVLQNGLKAFATVLGVTVTDGSKEVLLKPDRVFSAPPKPDSPFVVQNYLPDTTPPPAQLIKQPPQVATTLKKLP